MSRDLVVAAHTDDEVLGCCGTIARHPDSGDPVQVLTVAEGSISRQRELDRAKFEMKFQPWLKRHNRWIDHWLSECAAPRSSS